jgi:ATP-binding cassette subfamily B protein
MGKWTSILKLRPFLKKYSLTLCLGTIGMIISSLLAIPAPYLIGQILDKIVIGNVSYHTLYLWIGMIFGLYFLDYIISMLSKNLFSRINYSFINDIRYSVMSKVMDLPMSYLSNTEKGYVQERISECSMVGGIFSSTIISTFISIFSAILAAITMFAINYKLALAVLFLTPFFFYSSKVSTKGFMENSKDMMESNALLNGECFEIMNGIEDIKVLGGKEKHLAKFKAKINELVKYSVKQNKSIILFVGNIGLINNAGTLLILLISCILILKGEFSVGLYTSFSLYSLKVFASTQGLATFGTTLKPVLLSIERIFELLDMKDENAGKSKSLDSAIETLEFKQVTFQYKENLPSVFQKINFNLKTGDRVFLKGENGAGKTTLIKLLLGLYQPTSGDIIINGEDIMDMNCDSLRQRFGIVSQNIFLFRGTVLENILYGQNNKTRQDVEALIDKLGLREYISRLGKGLDTQINQNAAGVSGGQAQIIALIRAFLTNKDVMILDEPFSNVDAETRSLMLNILKETNDKGIYIVISHQSEGLDFLNKVIEISS